MELDIHTCVSLGLFHPEINGVITHITEITCVFRLTLWWCWLVVWFLLFRQVMSWFGIPFCGYSCESGNDSGEGVKKMSGSI